jgi:hypothetical protein
MLRLTKLTQDGLHNFEHTTSNNSQWKKKSLEQSSLKYIKKDTYFELSNSSTGEPNLIKERKRNNPRV